MDELQPSHTGPLKETGFDFLMDWPAERPAALDEDAFGPLMSVPYPIEINDSRRSWCATIRPSSSATSSSASSRKLLRQSAKQPLVCGIALHTMVVGQPYRLRMLRGGAAAHREPSAERTSVVHRPSAIYDHCAALPKGTMVPPPA